MQCTLCCVPHARYAGLFWVLNTTKALFVHNMWYAHFIACAHHVVYRVGVTVFCVVLAQPSLLFCATVDSVPSKSMAPSLVLPVCQPQVQSYEGGHRYPVRAVPVVCMHDSKVYETWTCVG